MIVARASLRELFRPVGGKNKCFRLKFCFPFLWLALNISVLMGCDHSGNHVVNCLSKRARYYLFQMFPKSNKYACIFTFFFSFNATSKSEHFLVHHKSILRSSSSNKCVNRCYSTIVQR